MTQPLIHLISERMRTVLNDLEYITMKIEELKAQDAASNDDFLTRGRIRDE